MTSFGWRIRAISQVFALAAVCVLTAQNSSAVCAAGGPTTTYQFVGQCADCTGTGVGLLTVQNYTLGGTLGYCNFVSFTYSSSLIPSFTVTQATFQGLSGMLPASLPASANVTIQGPTNQTSLYSYQTGFWSIGEVPADHGTTSSWSLPVTSVPALSVPMLIGLAMMLGLIGAILLKGLPKRRAA